MRNFNNIFYIIGVFLTFIGFIMYNYAISNSDDPQLVIAALTIGVGIEFLLTCYL